jgi:hypothetical protein
MEPGPQAMMPTKAISDHHYQRARACLAWGITPDYYDNMTYAEIHEWNRAAADLRG